MTSEINGEPSARTKELHSTNWIYFDTNCLSHLAKMHSGDQRPRIRRFVSEKDILITSSNLQELRKAPEVLHLLEPLLLDSNLFLVPDMSIFLYSEVSNLRNRNNKLPVDPVEFKLIPSGFFANMLYQSELEDAWSDVEKDLRNRYFATVNLDIGSNFDERKLCIHINSVITKLSLEWFQIVFLPWDCTPDNFPSFFSLFYTYYFRYAKNQVTPELNDFIDLENCLPLPYCERYYGERKFTTILKNNVQGRQPPTPFQLVKLHHKEGWLDDEGMQVIKNNKALFDHTSALLPNVSIFNFAEMLEQIEENSS